MDELVQTCAALNGMTCNQSLSDGPLQQTVISGYSDSSVTGIESNNMSYYYLHARYKLAFYSQKIHWQ